LESDDFCLFFITNEKPKATSTFVFSSLPAALKLFIDFEILFIYHHDGKKRENISFPSRQLFCNYTFSPNPKHGGR
jgi:hypothetical protein